MLRSSSSDGHKIPDMGPQSLSPDRTRVRRPLVALSAIGAALFVAALSFVCLLPVFMHHYPDCRPGNVDGQCGLGTFIAVVYALAISLAIWIFASLVFYFWFLWLRVHAGLRRDGLRSE